MKKSLAHILIAKYYLLVCRDLHSYLLGEQEDNDANQPVNNNNNNNPPHGGHNNNNNPAPAVGEGLHAAHQAILQQGGPVGFQPYHRPLRFPFRVRRSYDFNMFTSRFSVSPRLTVMGYSLWQVISYYNKFIVVFCFILFDEFTLLACVFYK